MSELKFGKRIRAVRKNAGCSQKEFCEILDIPQSTLSAYETDRMQPTIVSLVSIATKFNVSLDWLCGIELTDEDKKHNAVIEDIIKIYPTVIDMIVAIADKHNVIRDELIKYVSGLFSAVTEISTFAEWKKGERADINDNR